MKCTKCNREHNKSEMRQLIESQDKEKQFANELKKASDSDNLQEILKAQLKILASISRRLDGLEKFFRDEYVTEVVF